MGIFIKGIHRPKGNEVEVEVDQGGGTLSDPITTPVTIVIPTVGAIGSGSDSAFAIIAPPDPDDEDPYLVLVKNSNGDRIFCIDIEGNTHVEFPPGTRNEASFAVVGSSICFKILGDGSILAPDLPTSDPHVQGQLWNSIGTLKVSLG